MKKVFFTLLAATTVLLTGCGKSDVNNDIVPGGDQTVFTLTTEDATRATTTIAPIRYVMEVYSEDGKTTESVFNDGNGGFTYRAVATSGQFSATLDKTKAYTCFFWADDGTTYNVSSLKTVILTGSEITECYHAKTVVMKGKNPSVAIKLKRAVAKISLEEMLGVTVGQKLVARYNHYIAFDVSIGSPKGTTMLVNLTKTILEGKTTGVIGELLTFATPDKELVDFSFAYNDEPAKIVTNVPVQQNFVTNIKGEYSSLIDKTFSISEDGMWTTPDHEYEAGTFQMSSPEGELGRKTFENLHLVRISKD